MNILRRIGAPGVAALAGLLLVTAGFAATVVEAQVRMDAATAAVTLTSAQLEELRDAGITDVPQAAYRDWLIIGSMTSGARMPTLILEIGDDDDGGSWSWEPAVISSAGSMGGWQPKPLIAVSASGLALVIGSIFLAAARWRPRSSVPSN